MAEFALIWTFSIQRVRPLGRFRACKGGTRQIASLAEVWQRFAGDGATSLLLA